MDIDYIVGILPAVGIMGMIVAISAFGWDMMDKANKILEELKQIKEKLDKKD